MPESGGHRVEAPVQRERCRRSQGSRAVNDAQLNSGRFARLSGEDWRLIEPYLRENEALFGISVTELLRVNGEVQPPDRVSRKVEAPPPAGGKRAFA